MNEDAVSFYCAKICILKCVMNETVKQAGYVLSSISVEKEVRENIGMAGKSLSHDFKILFMQS